MPEREASFPPQKVEPKNTWGHNTEQFRQTQGTLQTRKGLLKTNKLWYRPINKASRIKKDFFKHPSRKPRTLHGGNDELGFILLNSNIQRRKVMEECLRGSEGKERGPKSFPLIKQSFTYREVTVRHCQIWRNLGDIAMSPFTGGKEEGQNYLTIRHSLPRNWSNYRISNVW